MDAIILGAGIAGLTAAYHLAQKGLKPLVLEKSSRWGGCIHSVLQNGCLLEKGPNSFLGGHETLMEHAFRLGLQSQVVKAQAAAKNRFLLSQERLIPFPKTPVEILKTPLLSLRGKLRLFLEPFIAVSGRMREESIAQFVSRRLGREALRLVQPMIQGIYAGDAHQLSMAAVAPHLAQWEKDHGSLFKALKKARFFSNGSTPYSFKNGMQTLANAFYKEMESHCILRCEAVTIRKLPKGWVAKWRHEGECSEEETSLVVLGVPAYEAARLMESSNPGLAFPLNSISYAPLAVLHIVVEQASLNRPLDGFGFLTGVSESSFLLGCLWSSSIFEGRCDSPFALLTCFAGGASNPGIRDAPEDQIVSKTLFELRQVFGVSLKIAEVFVTRHPRALPQYTLGHLEKIRDIQDRLSCFPGLGLVGNYLGGVSVNDTMKHAVSQMEGGEISLVARV